MAGRRRDAVSRRLLAPRLGPALHLPLALVPWALGPAITRSPIDRRARTTLLIATLARRTIRAWRSGVGPVAARRRRDSPLRLDADEDLAFAVDIIFRFSEDLNLNLVTCAAELFERESDCFVDRARLDFDATHPIHGLRCPCLFYVSGPL